MFNKSFSYFRNEQYTCERNISRFRVAYLKNCKGKFLKKYKNRSINSNKILLFLLNIEKNEHS